MSSSIRPRVRVAGLAALMAASASLAGCATTLQARLPAGFGPGATSYAVSGHSPRRFNEPVRIGPYSALEMREGDTFSWISAFGHADLRRSSKPYAYTLVARDLPPVEAQCLVRQWSAGAGTESRRVDLDLTSLAGPMLECGLRMDGEEPRGLRLAAEGLGLHGSLDAPWGARYAISSLAHYEGLRWRSGTPTGYRIAEGDRTLAVVDVVNAGRVHFDGSLDAERRVYFAAAAAALLMLDPELGE